MYTTHFCQGLQMQEVAVSLTDGPPYHSGSVQGLYHPNHQVRLISLFKVTE